MKVFCKYADKGQFHEGMILSVESIEFNMDTQVVELEVKHCTSYNDL